MTKPRADDDRLWVIEAMYGIADYASRNELYEVHAAALHAASVAREELLMIPWYVDPPNPEASMEPHTEPAMGPE